MTIRKQCDRFVVDLSGVTDEDVRDEFVVVLNCSYGAGKSGFSIADRGYWELFAESPKRSLLRYVVIAQLEDCLSHFEELGPHRWIAGIRALRPSILALMQGPKRCRDMEGLEALLCASEGRLFLTEYKAGDRPLQERALARALAATDPDCLVEVRATNDDLWLEFGDGLRTEFAWSHVPLPSGRKLRRETARVSEDLSSLEVLDEGEGVVDIDGAALRALADPKAAEALRILRKVASRSLGERLRAKREAAGLTQEELEARSGIDQPAISRLESGVHQPRFDTLSKYAKALRLSVSDLLS